MLDTGMAGALASLSGANNPLAPNPMGGYFAGALMNQEQGNNELNQQDQTLLNQNQAEQNTQLAAKTPQVQAEAALGTDVAQQTKTNYDQYGAQQMAAASNAQIQKSMADMSSSQMQQFNNHMDQAYTTGVMAEQYGATGEKDQTEADKRQKATEFLMSNTPQAKAAQNAINQEHQITGLPQIDFSQPDAMQHVFAASDAAMQTKQFRQEAQLTSMKLAGAQKGIETEVEGRANVAMYAAQEAFNNHLMQMPQDQAIVTSIVQNANAHNGQITQQQHDQLVSIQLNAIAQGPLEKGFQDSKSKNEQAYMSMSTDSLAEAAKANGVTVPSGGIGKDSPDRQIIANAIATKQYTQNLQKLADDTVAAKFPFKVVPNGSIPQTTGVVGRPNMPGTQMPGTGSMSTVGQFSTPSTGQSLPEPADGTVKQGFVYHTGPGGAANRNNWTKQ